MDWKEFYKKMHPNFSENELLIGHKDWINRFSIIFNWLNKYNFINNSKILDCGCGVGTSGLILKEKDFINVIGIDLDTYYLKHAKNNYTVCRMDCENLNFVDKSFDIVLALNLMEHLFNPNKFLDEAKRVLKDSGIFIASVPNTSFFRKLIRKAIVIPEHLHYWNCKSFKKLLKRKGFKVIDIKPVGRISLLPLCNTFITLSK